MHHPLIPLKDATFTLDSSGVAGFFGGDEAVSAMATVHVYEGRRWLGWYNSPGSYEIGKRYGQLANSRLWDGLFPGVNVDPATLFELDGEKGPRFKAAHSGTTIQQTGHLAHLFATACEDLEAVKVNGRESMRVAVTIADLHYCPPKEAYPKLLRTYSGLLASIPIIVSLGTCVVCAVYWDWYSFSMILLGIISSGVACYVIGSGQLVFKHPASTVAPGAPKGDGILITENGIVVLTGEEGAVTAVTRGRFALRLKSEPEYRNIGMAAVLLNVQFLAQLLLIPQAHLFGQLMFLASLAVSWAYNSYLSSLDKEKVQMEILDQVLDHPSKRKYSLGTRTTAAIFVLLVLDCLHPEKLLDEMLPNDTKAWRIWKEAVIPRLQSRKDFQFEGEDWERDDLDSDQKEMLKTLFGDAQAAYLGYLQHIASASKPDRKSEVSRVSEV
ncbi:hypothetical protein BKA93DRAFT_730116 [Sparassis latifolia]|uniref:Uncharacterized protein n=1 Tax=Sparassis crispa TaxID=139825 RepID=A0A401GZC4_9APHY|nr:hypothetical protein SCP_1101910 [Sparassis crispa]GBE87514.1 hypothetical protein SCP_1101910 [Sparassis crispa]